MRKSEECKACQTYRPRKKRQQQPQLPIDTIRFIPGECFQIDLYELEKFTYRTCIDKAKGLILSEKLKNKDSKSSIKALENMFLKINMPFMLKMDNGTNFTSKEFKTFCSRNNIELVRCAPYRHQGNGMAKKCGDTLKNMIRKENKMKIEV